MPLQDVRASVLSFAVPERSPHLKKKKALSSAPLGGTPVARTRGKRAFGGTEALKGDGRAVALKRGRVLGGSKKYGTTECQMQSAFPPAPSPVLP